MRETSEDRISNLPESALHHIHSFLFIKDSARTSVLSKRWKYIWTTVPILRFKNNASKTSKFMDFVDGTLHRHSSNVDKFSLICTQHLNKSRVHSWISNVIRCNVKELQLDLNQNHSFIPLSLFTCESLVSLYLGSHFDIIRLPKSIYFPRLKSLTLHAFNFSDESNSAILFLNCFVLEELILENCIYGRKFCVRNATLKLLKIHGVCSMNPDGVKDCTLLFYCPSLVTFIYSVNYFAKEYFLSTFVALKEAVISIIPIYSGGEMISIDKYAGISQLLEALAHVKFLTVNDLTLQAIRSVSNNLPTFHNVKVLNISDELNTVQGLIALLKASPNLESLIIAETIKNASQFKNKGLEDAEKLQNLCDGKFSTGANRDTPGRVEPSSAGTSTNTGVSNNGSESRTSLGKEQNREDENEDDSSLNAKGSGRKRKKEMEEASNDLLTEKVCSIVTSMETHLQHKKLALEKDNAAEFIKALDDLLEDDRIKMDQYLSISLKASEMPGWQKLFVSLESDERRVAFAHKLLEER